MPDRRKELIKERLPGKECFSTYYLTSKFVKKKLATWP